MQHFTTLGNAAYKFFKTFCANPAWAKCVGRDRRGWIFSRTSILLWTIKVWHGCKGWKNPSSSKLTIGWENNIVTQILLHGSREWHPPLCLRRLWREDDDWRGGYGDLHIVIKRSNHHSAERWPEHFTCNAQVKWTWNTSRIWGNTGAKISNRSNFVIIPHANITTPCNDR